MTTIDRSISADTDHELARRALWPLAGLIAVVAATVSAVFADSTTEAFVEVLFILVATPLVFGVVVARALRRPSAGGRGIVMGVLGLLVLLPAFWSGLPLILGSAGALVGHAGKRADSGAGRATTAFVVGLLACVGYAAFYVGDYLTAHGIG